jgi:hypothetical protein
VSEGTCRWPPYHEGLPALRMQRCPAGLGWIPRTRVRTQMEIWLRHAALVDTMPTRAPQQRLLRAASTAQVRLCCAGYALHWLPRITPPLLGGNTCAPAVQWPGGILCMHRTRSNAGDVCRQGAASSSWLSYMKQVLRDDGSKQVLLAFRAAVGSGITLGVANCEHANSS